MASICWLELDESGAARDVTVRTQLADTKILYTDLDGTLLGHRGRLLVDGNNQPSARTACAIVEVNRVPELTVMPTTGRSVTQLIEISRLCGWQDFIAEAGAVRSYWNNTTQTRENFYDTPMWPEEIARNGRTPLEIITDSGALEVLQAAFPGQLELHSPWNINRQATNVLRGRVDRIQAATLLADITPPLTFVENGNINPGKHGLSAGVGPIHAYHLAPAGVTKGAAIEADLFRRGLTRKDAVMIGDGLADLETATAVGLVFMVNNALESPGLEAQIARTSNAIVTHGKRGDGWAEVTGAWLSAHACKT